MKRLLASALCLVLSITLTPVNLVAAGRVLAQAGSISGLASVDGKPLGNVTVRVRNVDTGQIAGSTTANAQGQFAFTGLGPGNFVVETVSSTGTILGTSTAVALTPVSMVVTSVVVGTSAAALAAAGGVSSAAAAGAAVGTVPAGGGLSGAVIAIAAIAGGLAVTGIVMVANDSSPSQ